MYCLSTMHSVTDGRYYDDIWADHTPCSTFGQ